MMEVREVLRRLAASQSLREITRGTGLDRKTVRRYVEAASESGFVAGTSSLSEELVGEVTRRVQDRALPPPSDERVALDAQRARIAAWLEGGLRLTKVQVLLERDGVTSSYATLRRFAKDELGWGKRVASIRLDDPAPGEEAQIDFGCMGTMLDPESGRERKLWVLVVHLSHSRYSFVYPTFTQDLTTVCAGLDAAWQFFGGVPKRPPHGIDAARFAEKFELWCLTGGARRAATLGPSADCFCSAYPPPHGIDAARFAEKFELWCLTGGARRAATLGPSADCFVE